MATCTLQELKPQLERESRLLGLDPGSKTIGLALSDVGRMIATPYRTIQRKKFKDDVVVLKSIMTEEGVGGLVIGLPIGMDGSEGPRCQSVRQLAQNLLQHMDVPIAFWDERLSTAAVQRLLVRDVDMTRKRRAEVVDKMAAAYILQGALDALRGATG